MARSVDAKPCECLCAISQAIRTAARLSWQSRAQAANVVCSLGWFIPFRSIETERSNFLSASILSFSCCAFRLSSRSCSTTLAHVLRNICRVLLASALKNFSRAFMAMQLFCSRSAISAFTSSIRAFQQWKLCFRSCREDPCKRVAAARCTWACFACDSCWRSIWKASIRLSSRLLTQALVHTCSTALSAAWQNLPSAFTAATERRDFSRMALRSFLASLTSSYHAWKALRRSWRSLPPDMAPMLFSICRSRCSEILSRSLSRLALRLSCQMLVQALRAMATSPASCAPHIFPSACRATADLFAASTSANSCWALWSCRRLFQLPNVSPSSVLSDCIDQTPRARSNERCCASLRRRSSSLSSAFSFSSAS
mmetsp:Transcript_34851/g.76168  ORF Transcript_34851/g.76168 Transcript_34851/m.76168 type:complete len:370 (+) Transcript_34851:1405-2514(+)